MTSCCFVPDGQSTATNVLATAHYDWQRNQVMAKYYLLLGSHVVVVVDAFMPGVKTTHAQSRPIFGVSHQCV